MKVTLMIYAGMLFFPIYALAEVKCYKDTEGKEHCVKIDDNCGSSSECGTNSDVAKTKTLPNGKLKNSRDGARPNSQELLNLKDKQDIMDKASKEMRSRK